METDLLAMICDLKEGKLQRASLCEDAAVTVIMASNGYPGAYEKGSVIAGLDEAASPQNVTIYHAGTAHDAGGRLVASGGRVLAVTALGADIAQARSAAYEAVAQVKWDDGFYRRDIAKSAAESL